VRADILAAITAPAIASLDGHLGCALQRGIAGVSVRRLGLEISCFSGRG